MKKAYIVLAHKDAAMVKRMISRLNDGNSHFFLHVDLNSSFNEFASILPDDLPVTTLTRNRCCWGDFGMVEATLRGLRTILIKGVSYDRIFLISGQHYPIKPPDAANAHILALPHANCMEYFEITENHAWKTRFTRYYFGQARWQRWWARLANLAGEYIPCLRRTMPLQGPAFGGSSWWTIDMEAAKYIVEFIQRRPDVEAFFRRVRSPDESFFQSILLSGDDSKFQHKIHNGNLTIIEWDSANSPHPRTLTMRDLDKIGDSDAVMARKFDPQIDSTILNEIDKLL